MIEADTRMAPPTPEPDGAPRLASLDVLRGLAILAVLFLNIGDMGGSMIAASADPRHLGWTRVDRAAWLAREVLLSGTARAMLELLFGAGMVILTDRAATRASSVLGGYARRNLVLLALGLVHVFVLLWPGDILHTYALAALVAVLFRGLEPRGLLMTGLFMATLQMVAGAPMLIGEWQEAARTAAAQARAARDETLNGEERQLLAAAVAEAKTQVATRARTERQVAEEDTARTGGAGAWAGQAWAQFVDWQREGLELQWVWEAASTMLIGAALFRLGVLQGGRTPGFYLAVLVAGYALGLAVRVPGALAGMQVVPAPNIAWVASEYGRLAMTMGHLGAVHLLLRSQVGTRLLAPFAAAGRLALSIYVAQTLIGLWLLFPPFGLALYGRLGWAALMGVALAIDAALLAAAVLYLRQRRIGPVEWAWRSAVKRRTLAWR